MSGLTVHVGGRLIPETGSQIRIFVVDVEYQLNICYPVNVNMKAKTFGEALRELRRSQNVSQRDLADKVGVDFSYISKVENDRLPPPAADTIEKICAALGVSSSELLSLTGKVPTQVKEMLGTNSAAMEFAKQAQAMELTDDEWKKMTQRLKRLRKY